MIATPYELLLGMSLLREKQAQIQAQQRNYHHEPHALAGAAFLRIRLAQHCFLIVQDAVKEVMPILKIAEVTPAQSWLFGFASYKGELLPVIDMQRLPKFLSSDLSSNATLVTQDYASAIHESYRQSRTDNARILVLEGVEGLLGIYVDAVLGIQHYWLHAEGNGQANTWHQAWVKIDDKLHDNKQRSQATNQHAKQQAKQQEQAKQQDDQQADRQQHQQQNSECLPVLNMQKIIQYCHLARH